MFGFLRRNAYNNKALEPQELQAVGLFLTPDRPYHEVVLKQLADTPEVRRRWTDEGYTLSISFYDDGSRLARAVTSERIEVPLSGGEGNLTFWVDIDDDGLFNALHVQAPAGVLSAKELWTADFTGVQPAFVDLELAAVAPERFAELADFLGIEADALRSWADAVGADIVWHPKGDAPKDTVGDASYREFSALVDSMEVDDRFLFGGTTEYDVDIDGEEYGFISYNREIDNVLLARDAIRVDDTVYRDVDFRTFLINFFEIPTS